MTDQSKKSLVSGICKLLWVSACIAVFANLILSLNRNSGDAEIAGIFGMMALSFPSCWIALGFVVVGVDCLSESSSALLRALVIWVPFFVLGYLQWFVIVPHLFRSWKQHRERARELITIAPRN